MAVFDPLIFDSVIFDTGAVAVVAEPFVRVIFGERAYEECRTTCKRSHYLRDYDKRVN